MGQGAFEMKQCRILICKLILTHPVASMMLSHSFLKRG